MIASVCRLTNGAGVRLMGTLSESLGTGQKVELVADSVDVLGECDPAVRLWFLFQNLLVAHWIADIPHSEAESFYRIPAGPCTSSNANRRVCSRPAPPRPSHEVIKQLVFGMHVSTHTPHSRPSPHHSKTTSHTHIPPSSPRSTPKAPARPSASPPSSPPPAPAHPKNSSRSPPISRSRPSYTSKPSRARSRASGRSRPASAPSARRPRGTSPSSGCSRPNGRSPHA